MPTTMTPKSRKRNASSVAQPSYIRSRRGSSLCAAPIPSSEIGTRSTPRPIMPPPAAVAPGDVVRLTSDVGKYSLGAGGTVTDVWQAGANEEGEMGPCCSELDAAPITVRLDRTRVRPGYVKW